MRWKWAGGIAASCAAAGLCPFLASRVTPEGILSLVPQNLLLAALVVIGIFMLKNVLVMIPLTALYIACGLLFGAGWGIVVAYVGLACEISLGYWVGKKAGKDRIQALVQKKPRAEEVYCLLSRAPQASCFLARLIPLPLPVDLVSMFFGASGVSFTPYLVFSLLGLSGKMLPYVIAGKAIFNPLSAEFLVPLAIGLTASGLGLALRRHGQKNTRKDD